jgi:hypothetical protein
MHRLKVMFKCQNCQIIVPTTISAQRVVVERRYKVYPLRKRAIRAINKEGKPVLVDDEGGEGWEIARELIVCPDCACKLT